MSMGDINYLSWSMPLWTVANNHELMSYNCTFILVLPLLIILLFFLVSNVHHLPSTFIMKTGKSLCEKGTLNNRVYVFLIFLMAIITIYEL